MKTNKAYYVTTPIYYANGRPHIGNTYTTALADTLARYYRYCGAETFFLTGTDEHGDKVFRAAEAVGKTPEVFTDEVSELFQSTWAKLGFHYDRFIRTSEAEHKRVVQSILQKVYDKQDIYFGEYGGKYCVGCERFLTDKELVDGKCPDHQIEPEYVEEKNYFFRMSKYQDQLIKHIQKNPDFIRPERYKNEVLALLREPLEDLCISRPKSRLTWGIELPFDKEYVTYVWFDALINYVSGVDYPSGERFSRFWPVCEHLIAKDIVKPHGVFWPTMLLSADIPLFQHLTVHGYWVTPTGKMSKSLGNVVDPLQIKEKVGTDVYRYFVFREMTFGLDGSFSGEALEARYTADLANNLGNLVSRSLAMVHRYRNGVIPDIGKAQEDDALDRELREKAAHAAVAFHADVERRAFQRALEGLWFVIDAANVYIDRTKPWDLAKDPAHAARLDSVLYYQVETIRIVASILTAFMPDTSRQILALLGYTDAEIENEQCFEAAAEWGRTAAGRSVQKAVPLFPRLETSEAKTAEQPKPAQKIQTKQQEKKKDGRKRHFN